jgi:DNA-binding CsgD family transcriptional regulator
VTVAVDSPLVEREREIAAIERVLAAARAGVGAALLVEGPPGIGKSRVLAAAHGLAAPGLRVVRARGSELERDFPFAVVRQLLEPVLMGAPEQERRELLAGAGALAEPVLSTPATGDTDVAAALHGLYWFTANLAARGPLVLLVDDLHWADGSSLRWLAYFAHRLDGLAVALVAASRPAENDREQHLLDQLAANPQVELLHPGALSEAGVAQLAGEALGAPPEPRFAAASRRVTGGNPFLLGELLRELASGSVAPSDGNAPLVERLTSRGVSRAASARLRRLPPACRAMALAVVVLGDGAESPFASRLAELDPEAAGVAADALTNAAILAPGRPLAFVHPLVRASVYAELGAGERSDWHARAAALLTEAGEPVDRIAVHLLACDPRADPDAVRVLREAAVDARRRGALEVAVTYLRRALREPPPPELEPWLAFELGVAEFRLVGADGAIPHLRRATDALPDPSSRALAAAQLGSALAFTQRPDEGVAVLNEAIAQLPDDARELGLVLQVARAMVAPGSLDAWRLMEAAGTRFDASGERPATTGERLHVAELALQATLRSSAENARRLALRALADGELLADPGPAPQLVFKAPLALWWADALDDAGRVLSALLDLARRYGSAMMFAQASHMRAGVWWRRGALAEAEADAEEVLDAPSPQMRIGVLMLVEVRLARGDVDGAAELWRTSGLETHHGSGRAEVIPLQTRARLHAAQGHTREALADLRRCGELELAWDIRTPAHSTWRSDAAALLAAHGDREQARRLIDEELARCRAFGAPRPLGVALRTAGLLDGDLDLLAEAVEVLAASPARLEHAHALVELGAAQRRAGRRADARAPLRDAIDLATQCGADPLAARAHDELVAAGARPRRDPIESRTHLTASELRVARLAAEGMTNREIAQALFLTAKTIELHLTNSYRKLDIASRSQLARALPATPAG